MKRSDRVEISEFFFHIVNHDTIFDRGGGKCMYHCFSEEGGGQVRIVYKCNIFKIKGQFLRNNFVYEVKGSASPCSPFASPL